MAKTTTTEESGKLSFLEKKYGKGVVIQVSKSIDYTKEVEYISTGSLMLDRAIANGGKCFGIPLNGAVTQLVAEYSCGKSTLAYSIIKEANKKGERVLLVDVEGSATIDYLQCVGVDIDMVDVIDTDILLSAMAIKGRNYLAIEEYAGFIADALVSDDYGLIILDSLPAMLPAAEARLEDDKTANVSGNAVGGVARPWGKAYRLWTGALHHTRSGLLIINQFRSTLDMYGPSKAPTGGKSLQFLMSLSISLSRQLDRDKERNVGGMFIKASVEKSKVSPPFGKATYYLTLDQGIDKDYDVYTLAVAQGLIKKGGAWFELPEVEQKIQGEDKVLTFLADNPEYTEKLISQLKLD